MPKRTAKYVGAITTAHNHNLPTLTTHTQEELYAQLQQAGFFWDSKIKKWEYHEPELADEPTPLVMIRVWGSGEVIEEAADDIVAAFNRHPHTQNWRLTKRSPVYGCRPPKQQEGRIYLEFLPKEASNGRK